MSLLLDALNKADQDRKRSGENPTISSNHDGYASQTVAPSSALIKLLVAGIGLAVLLLAVYWLGKKNQQTPIESVASNSATQPAVTATKAVASIAASSLESDNSAPAPAPLAADTVTAADQENIASLYQNQAQVNTAAVATPREQLQAEVAATASSQASVALPTAAPLTLAAFANLPGIQDLPSTVSQRIPSLKYSEHNYNENGGSVVINGMVKHANEQIVAGVVIDKILIDGMILHFENYSFKMPAMNTWINM